MKKKVPIYFLIIFFFFIQTDKIFSQTNNSIIISVGNHPITRLDLLKEIKLIAILSNTEITDSNQEQIKTLAVKSLIKRNIKKNEIKKRNIDRYNKNQLEALINNACKKLGVDRNGLKNILDRYNLSYENLIKKFQVDLKWNYMIFEMYKNKISLNTSEIESKINLYLENSKDIKKEQDIKLIKEKIVNQEKEKKLKMFSNLHYSNLERSTQIKFL
mgnify:CR=1 FL=1